MSANHLAPETLSIIIMVLPKAWMHFCVYNVEVCQKRGSFCAWLYCLPFLFLFSMKFGIYYNLPDYFSLILQCFHPAFQTRHGPSDIVPANKCSVFDWQNHSNIQYVI